MPRPFEEERMRRTRRNIGVAISVALALALAACGGDGEPEATDLVDDATDDTVDDAVDDVTDDTVDDAVDDATDDATDDTADDGTDDGADDGEPDPQPDPDLVADPCGPHEGREADAFLDLVAPVDEQRVGDEVEIVGCSNVFEATVSYRVLDGDGETLEEGFTTAECGTGCVGAFRDTVDLSAAAGEPVAYLQVFWQSPKDGSDEDLVERIVVLE